MAMVTRKVYPAAQPIGQRRRAGMSTCGGAPVSLIR